MAIVPGETIKLTAQFTNDSGEKVTPSEPVTITIWKSDGTKAEDNTTVQESVTTNGYYEFSYTVALTGTLKWQYESADGSIEEASIFVNDKDRQLFSVREMQKGVQQQLNAMDIPLMSQDIIHYLNRAQDKFIDEQYVFLRGKYTDQQNIELYQTAQKAIENLRTIIETEIIDSADINDTAQFDNAKSTSLRILTEEFYYYVRSQTRLSDGGDWVNNKLIEQDNIQKFTKTKYNFPVFRDFLVLLEGNNMYVFYDLQEGADVHEIALTYIRTPGKMVLENPLGNEVTKCELPKHTHRNIIDIAVALIVQDQQGLGNPRLADQQNQTNQNTLDQQQASN